MTREKLEQYISMQEEIEELTERLKNLKNDEDLILADTAKDYNSGKGVTVDLVGFDQDKYWKRRQRYEKKIRNLVNECSEIESWVERIEDSLTRRIFRLTYLQGLTLTDTGELVHMDRTTVGKRIRAYLKQH